MLNLERRKQMANGNNIFIRLQASAGNVSKVFKNATDSTLRFGKATNQTSSSVKRFQAENHKLSKSLQSITKDGNRAGQTLNGLSKSMSGVNQLIGMGKAVAILSTIGNMTQSAIDMIETANLFGVSMGKNTAEAQKFVDAMSTAYGFDATNIQSAVGTYGLLARSMGLSADQATTLATNTTKLAVDLSSLVNVPINQVMADLRSGLVGQTETVYKYGVDITEAGLKTEAMALGIKKSVRNMSQGEKMALRYSKMIRDTSLAQGDFARTFNTPANQLKVFSERMITAGRAIGSIFIPMLGAVLPYANAFLIVITNIANAIAKLFGYTPPEATNVLGDMGSVAQDDADAIDGVTDSLKKMKQYTMGFDELNVIDTTQKEGGDGVGGASILPQIDIATYDNMISKVRDISKELAEKVQPTIENILKFVGLIGVAFGTWKILELATFIGGLIVQVVALAGAFGAVVAMKVASIAQDVIMMATGLWTWITTMTTALWLQVRAWVALGIEKLVSIGRDIAMNASGLWTWITTVTTAIWLQVKGWVALAIEKAVSIGKDMLMTASTIATWLALTTKQLWLQVTGFIALAVQQGLQIAKNALLTASVVAYNIATGLATALTTAFGIAMVILTSPITLVIGAIALLVAGIVLLYKNWDTVKAKATEVWNSVKSTWEKAGEWFNGIGKAIVDGLFQGINNISDKIITFKNNLVSGIKDALGIKSPSKVMETEIGKPMGEGIAKGLDGQESGIVSVAQKIANAVQSVFDKVKPPTLSATQSAGYSLMDAPNRGGTATTSSSGGGSYSSSSGTSLGNTSSNQYQYLSSLVSKGGGNAEWAKAEIKAGRYATGGFPPMGEMFVANENGAEMIGKIGNKTAVVNNEQIVSAVASGVAQAVQSVMGGQNEKPIVVTLDGEVIYKNQQKISNNRGINFGMGVFAR